jgi:Protein of unknown function (DUF995)
MRRLILSMSILSFCAIVGGAKSAAFATKNEIVSAYDGNTLYQETSWYEFAGYYHADGTVRGRGWNWMGEETSAGEWRVSDDGRFCVRWNRKDWGDGEENCYNVELNGDKTQIIHIAGSGGEDRNFVIKKGNPYQL